MTQNYSEEILRLNSRLKGLLLNKMPDHGLYSTSIESLRISRRNEAGKPEHCVDKPLISLIVQGGKRSVMGAKHVQYSENQCLTIGVDMPNAFQVNHASPEQPFLGIALYLDKQLIAQLMTEIELAPQFEDNSFSGVSVSDAPPELLDAFMRIVELLDNPERIPVFAPMILREIHYFMLTSPQGTHLRHINTLGSSSHQVSKTISWMRDNFKESMQVDSLARNVNMATSTFHRHFKDITSLSPLQYIKHLRLYEAQRLMLVESYDANTAGLAVGYESTAQFNREYKRMFGEPPRRDVNRLR